MFCYFPKNVFATEVTYSTKFILIKQVLYHIIPPRIIKQPQSIIHQRKVLLVFISSQTVVVHICKPAAA